MNTLEECLTALENGYIITCHNGATLRKRPDSVYEYTPFLEASIVAVASTTITTPDRDSLFAFLVLREAVIDPSHEILQPPEGFVEADDMFIPYGGDYEIGHEK